MTSLSIYGWTHEQDIAWQHLEQTGVRPARVVADFGTSLKVALPEIITAELSGKLAHYTRRDESAKIGDWVAVRVSDNGNAVIEAVLPRQSELARRAPGNVTTKQILAVNIDTAFVVLAVGNDFNIDRLRRFLYQLSVSNITPVIILNKADTTDEIDTYLSQLASFEIPVIPTVANKNEGIERIREYIQPYHTVVLLGSSGVGKSTLTNALLGTATQETQTVRSSDERGRHTTVHRELFRLPGGGLLIDMPGIREFQLWGSEEDLKDTFEDIRTLADRCKYSNCRHGNEDGCAVQQALRSGALTLSRYTAYMKMKHELEGLKRRADVAAKRDSQRAKRMAVKKRHKDSLKHTRDYE